MLLNKSQTQNLISDVLLGTPPHGRANIGWPTWTYLQLLCTHKSYIHIGLENLLEALEDRDERGLMKSV